MTRTLFRGGTVFDGHTIGSGPTDVVIEGGRIIDVGTGLDGDEVVECEGRSVVPGLFDCHVHVTARDMDIVRSQRDPFSLFFYEAIGNMARLIDVGITNARDCAGADLGMKVALERGLIEGPRLQISIVMISQTGGHFDRCLPCGERLPVPSMMAHPGRPESVVDGPDAVRQKVREVLRNGADCIKIASSGGISSPNDDPRHAHFRDDELHEIVAEAEAAQTYVLSHAQGTQGIKNAVRAGARSIEHGFYLDDEGIELMLERGTWLVPTLSSAHGIIERDSRSKMTERAYAQKLDAWEAQRETIGKAVAAGVKIAMGSDAPIIPWGLNLIELTMLAKYGGASPEACWRSATSSAAELLRVDEELGSLEPGKVADVVVLDGSLLDLDDLGSRVQQVWQAGTRLR